MDFKLYFSKQIGNRKNVKHPFKEFIILFSTKLFYIFYTILLPYLVLDFSWNIIFCGFMIMHISAGLLAVLSHFIEGPAFPAPDEKGIIHNNWAAHEIETTLDFAPDSKFMNWISGGLNTHVAHHLFPNICISPKLSGRFNRNLIFVTRKQHCGMP
ncbi:MAG: fatty acid desaturase [Cytophagaceae bacterium]|nr:fatty acid desaturase [Cytophagaceae bacterium]